MTARRAAVVAVALATLAAACSSDSSAGEDRTSESTSLDDGTTTTASTLALARRDPTELLVADGIQFGTAPPPLAASLDAYRDDVAVLDADGAIAWGPGPVRVAEVVVLALDPAAFTDQSLLDVYLARFGTAARGAAHVETFQRDNLLAVLRGAEAARVRDLVLRMQAAFDAGRTGTDTRFTPLRAVPPGSVFVALQTARFDPYPAGGEETPPSTPTTQPPPPPPPAPSLPGIGGVQSDVRRVVVANEVRARRVGAGRPLVAGDVGGGARAGDPRRGPAACAARPPPRSSSTASCGRRIRPMTGQRCARSDTTTSWSSSRGRTRSSSTRSSRPGSRRWAPAEPRAYSCTSSISVPKLPFGCTNATVVPRLPGRGASSIAVAPAATIAASAAAQSSTR